VKDQLTSLLDLRRKLDTAETAVNAILRPFVEQANEAYWQAERRIHKKHGYDYATTCYDYLIGNNTIDEFDLHVAAGDEFYMVRCCWEDNQCEDFRWTLKIPYDMDKLPEYIKRFEENGDFRANKNASKKKCAKEASQRREYEALKAKFEPLKEKFETDPSVTAEEYTTE
jgi:hypothetical protein